MSNYVYLVPLFPLIGFLINGLFRKSISKSLAGFVGSAMILASFIVSAGIFFQVKQEGFQPVTVTLFQFIHAGDLKIPFSFLVDPLSTIFLLIVTGVGFLIHLYSVAYMNDENPPDYAKYFCFLNLFVFSMLLLVLGANFVILFIGWEGVGLCSYLLIGYWFKNLDYGNAAKKAFVMNRIGDLGFLIAIFAIISQFGSVSFDIVFKQAPAASTGFLTAVT
jgi:NADH-quinone oxidoreductase subunit L